MCERNSPWDYFRSIQYKQHCQQIVEITHHVVAVWLHAELPSEFEAQLLERALLFHHRSLGCISTYYYRHSITYKSIFSGYWWIHSRRGRWIIVNTNTLLRHAVVKIQQKRCSTWIFSKRMITICFKNSSRPPSPNLNHHHQKIVAENTHHPEDHGNSKGSRRASMVFEFYLLSGSEACFNQRLTPWPLFLKQTVIFQCTIQRRTLSKDRQALFSLSLSLTHTHTMSSQYHYMRNYRQSNDQDPYANSDIINARIEKWIIENLISTIIIFISVIIIVIGGVVSKYSEYGKYIACVGGGIILCIILFHFVPWNFKKKNMKMSQILEPFHFVPWNFKKKNMKVIPIIGSDKNRPTGKV